MNTKEALAELERLGSEPFRKTYARHGVRGPTFGVSYASLGKLAKKIAVDHALAVGLWKSGNHDARILATMVGDPERADARLLDAWIEDLDSYVLADAFSGFAARSPIARSRMQEWIKAPKARGEWIAVTGWNVLARLAGDDEELSDADLEKRLAAIEKDIHRSPNRVRHAMNAAVIAIGLRPSLEARAIAAAGRIGEVEVDHGDTDCKTPDAAAYIRKCAQRRRKVAPKRKKAPAKARS